MAVILEVVVRTRKSRRQVLEAIRRATTTAANSFRSRRASSLLVRTGLAVQQVLYEAFQVKSRGGTDAAGLRWAPLAPATIAWRRSHGDRRRNLLVLQFTRAMIATLKPAARPTSTNPSVPTVDDQVFRLAPGSVTVGSKEYKAVRHHEGRPPKLPQRRLWPPPSRWPPAWWSRILETVVRALVRVISEEVK